MPGESGFRINSPAVVGETIDGETIIINLKTGTYLLDETNLQVEEIPAGRRFSESPVSV